MCLKRFLCMILACALAFGCAGVPAKAAEIEVTPPENVAMNFQIPRATSSFRMTIPANQRLAASTSFPLAAGRDRYNQSLVLSLFCEHRCWPDRSGW